MGGNRTGNDDATWTARNPFLVAVAFIIKANVIFYRILDKVNAARQRSDQISFLFVGLRFTEIIGEHARLFPADRKRNQMKASAGIGFALLLVLFAVLAVMH